VAARWLSAAASPPYFFAARLLRVSFVRCNFATFKANFEFAPLISRSTWSARSLRACARFECALRCTCDTAVMPVGSCTSLALVARLLTFWPPGPLLRENDLRTSRSKSITTGVAGDRDDDAANRRAERVIINKNVSFLRVHIAPGPAEPALPAAPVPVCVGWCCDTPLWSLVPKSAASP
jgi:hypothetical protein